MVQVMRPTRWIRPPARLAKINVDATVSKNLGCAIGAAFFWGASALVMEGYTDAEVVEAVACREGLALASDFGLQAVSMSSDCANAVRSI